MIAIPPLRRSLALLSLAAVAAAPVSADVYGWGGKERRVQREHPGDAAGGRRSPQGRQCASVGKIVAATATTDSDLVLHEGADHIWISHLETPCDGLKSINNLGRIKLPKRGRYCSGETFEVWAPGDDAPTRCTFGPFEGGSEALVPEFMRR